jgi:hypothetical protein
VVGENAVLRWTWPALRHLAGVTQSQTLIDLDAWVAATDDVAATPLRGCVTASIGGTDADAFGSAVAYLHTNPESERLLHRWWRESIRPLLPADVAPVLDEVFRYDLLSRPLRRPSDGTSSGSQLPVVSVDNEEYYLHRGVPLSYDVPAIVTAIRTGAEPDLSPKHKTVDLYYRTGVESFITTTNHEIVMQFMGMTEDQIRRGTPGGGGQTTDDTMLLPAPSGPPTVLLDTVPSTRWPGLTSYDPAPS